MKVRNLIRAAEHKVVGGFIHACGSGTYLEKGP